VNQPTTSTTTLAEPAELNSEIDPEVPTWTSTRLQRVAPGPKLTVEVPVGAPPAGQAVT